MNFVRINIQDFGKDNSTVVNLDQVAYLQARETKDKSKSWYELGFCTVGTPGDEYNNKVPNTMFRHRLSTQQGKALQDYIASKSVGAGGQLGIPDVSQSSDFAAKAPSSNSDF